MPLWFLLVLWCLEKLNNGSRDQASSPRLSHSPETIQLACTFPHQNLNPRKHLLRWHEQRAHFKPRRSPNPLLRLGTLRPFLEGQASDLGRYQPHGHACIAEPWRLLSVDSAEILKRVKDEYLVGGNGVVCLGGFRNVRAVHEWKALKLELDECIILCSISCLWYLMFRKVKNTFLDIIYIQGFIRVRLFSNGLYKFWLNNKEGVTILWGFYDNKAVQHYHVRVFYGKIIPRELWNPKLQLNVVWKLYISYYVEHSDHCTLEMTSLVY